MYSQRLQPFVRKKKNQVVEFECKVKFINKNSLVIFNLTTNSLPVFILYARKAHCENVKDFDQK